MGNEWLETFKAIGSLLSNIFTLEIIGISIVCGLVAGLIIYFQLKAQAKEPSPTLDDVFIKFQCPNCDKHNERTVSYLVLTGVERPPYCNCTEDKSLYKIVDTYIQR